MKSDVLARVEGRRPLTVLSALCAALLASPPAAAHGDRPHEHGRATLTVAIDGNVVTVALESPLDNLLGFERRPRTAKEREAARALRTQLEQPARLFTFAPDAGCRLDAVELDAPVLGDEAPSPADAAGPSAQAETHADVDAQWRYVCAEPARLQRLGIGLFDAFPRLSRVDAAVAGPAGQQRHALRRGDAAASLPLAGR